ncbi:hypothetical protein ABBQ38_010686 [Trebouxia sp. C0009 RCD-2024]
MSAAVDSFLTGLAIETAEIVAVMDANDDANVEFMAGEPAAEVEHCTVHVLLSAKMDAYSVGQPH